MQLFDWGRTESLRTLSRGAAVALIVKVGAVGLAFGSHILLTRWLSVEEYGRYVYAMGWAVPLAALGGAGLRLVALRFVPEYRSSSRDGLVRGVYRFGIYRTLILSGLLTITACSVVWLFRTSLSHEMFVVLTLGFVLIPLMAAVGYQASFLRALKRVGLASLGLVLRPPLLVVGAGLYLWLGFSLAAREVLLILVPTLLITIAVQHVLVRIQAGRAFDVPAERDVGAWTAVVGSMLLIEIFRAVMMKADVILLGALGTVEDVAVYGVAGRIAGLIGFVVASVNMIGAPIYTGLHSKGKKRELQNTVRGAWHWMAWPSLGLGLLMLLTSGFLMGLFGSEYVTGRTVLWILIAAQLSYAVAGPVFVLVTFTGFHAYSARVYGVTLGLNLILNVVLIQLAGMHGAAIASLVSGAIWNIWLHILVTRRLGIAASPFSARSGVEDRR